MSKSVTHVYKPDQIEGAIVTVEKDAKSLQQKIHNIAASILQHWQDIAGKSSCKDEDAIGVAKEAAVLLSKLQEASPYHRNAFSKWVGMFCPLHWSEENKVWYVNVEDEYRLKGKAFMEARDTPFWKVSPPPAAKPFVMYTELERLVSKAVKHSAKHVEGDAFNTEATNKLREAMAILEAEGLAPAD